MKKLLNTKMQAVEITAPHVSVVLHIARKAAPQPSAGEASEPRERYAPRYAR